MLNFSLPPEGVVGSKFLHNYPYIFFPITGGGGGVKRGRTNFTISVVFFFGRIPLEIPKTTSHTPTADKRKPCSDCFRFS